MRDLVVNRVRFRHEAFGGESVALIAYREIAIRLQEASLLGVGEREVRDLMQERHLLPREPRGVDVAHAGAKRDEGGGEGGGVEGGCIHAPNVQHSIEYRNIYFIFFASLMQKHVNNKKRANINKKLLP